jgi:hypothetical protein
MARASKRKGRPDPTDRPRVPATGRDQGPDVRATGIPDNWAGPWLAFEERHRSWWSRVGGRGPVYALPELVIEALVKDLPSAESSHRPSPALIGAEDAEAEVDFLETCKRYMPTIVGVWDGRPVEYVLLCEPPPGAFRDEDVEALARSWGRPFEAVRSMIEATVPRLQPGRHQLLGTVGRLTFDDQFRSQKAALERRWFELVDRPAFPLRASDWDRRPEAVVSLEEYRDQILPEERVKFQDDTCIFMRRWGLAEMLTWDLLVPQAPMEDVPVRLLDTVLGPRARARSYPSHHDIPANVDVRQDIREEQSRAAREAGIEEEHPLTDTSPRGDSPSKYEGAFRMWLIEQAVVSRYGRPHGLVARLLPAFAELFKFSNERAKQIRDLYRTYIEYSN